MGELKRQTKGYESIKKTYKKVILVNVDHPLNDVVDEITKTIILYKAKCTAKAMKKTIDREGILVNK
jgi:thymidylate kinase